MPLALTVLVFSIGVAVVVAPNWNVVFVAGAVVVVPVQLPNRDREGVWVDGAADDVETVTGWVLVNPPNDIPLFCETEAAGVDVVGVAVCPKALMPLPVPNKGLKVGWVGLTSAVEAGVVLAAPKMGLNPDDRGLANAIDWCNCGHRCRNCGFRRHRCRSGHGFNQTEQAASSAQGWLA